VAGQGLRISINQEIQMKTIRNLALAAAAAGALAAATATFAQDVKKEEPKAKTEAQHARGEHRGHGMGAMGGMGSMAGMQERCHGVAQAQGGEHEHK